MMPLPLLTAPSTVLRSPEESDLGLLYALRNNIQIQMLVLTQPRANSLARVKEWLAKSANDPQSVFFVIGSLKDALAPVGYVQLTNMDFVHGTAELGICLDEAARGQGHALEALRLLEQYGHDVFNIRKIILRVMASNERAIALYTKACFRKVGLLQQHFYQRGTFHDVLIMEKIFAQKGCGLP